MNKIINGKRYDTDTAKKVAYHQVGYPRDFHFWMESLYQKRTGEFFLYGEGGPSSKYAESVGMNEWSGGEKIIPLSFDKAREWAEEYLDGDEYESIFGAVAEDTSKKTVTFSLTVDAIEKLKREAGKTGKNQSEIIQSLIESL